MSTTAEDRSQGQVLCTSSGTPQGRSAEDIYVIGVVTQNKRWFTRVGSL
jgi:hypothetical protein